MTMRILKPFLTSINLLAICVLALVYLVDAFAFTIAGMDLRGFAKVHQYRKIPASNPAFANCRLKYKTGIHQIQSQDACPVNFDTVSIFSRGHSPFDTEGSDCSSIDGTKPNVQHPTSPSQTALATDFESSTPRSLLAPRAPPGPLGLPLLGHLLHFLWHGDLAEMLAALAARHGPVAAARLLGRPIFFVSDPVLVREVLLALADLAVLPILDLGHSP